VTAADFSETVKLRVNVTSASAVPTDFVQVLDGERVIVELRASTGPLIHTTTLPPGVHILTARYLGDAVVPPSVSSPVVHTVSDTGDLEQTRIKLSAKQRKGAPTVSVDILISGSSAPTGKVMLYLDGHQLDILDLSPVSASVALATVELPPLFPGSEHDVVAIYEGSPRHAGSSGEIKLRIDK
jgi:hypothetical protein